MNPVEIVDRFIRCIEAKDLESALALVAPDVEYDNVPMGVVRGPEGVRAVIAPFVAKADAIAWVVHRTTATGDVVMNERTDRFRIGGKWLEVKVAGVWRVESGRISLWRDYFDLKSFTDQVALFPELQG